MDEKTIRIACEGTTTVILDELKELQSYKELSTEAYGKMKESILKLGFSFPVLFWEDNDGTKYVIDAHQRKRVLMKMRSEDGFAIPPLPAVRIHAKDKREAKEKILAQESQYGKITQEGLYEFINEEGFELDPIELESFVEIDEFQFEQEASETPEQEEQKEKKEECDQCKVFHFNSHQIG